MMKRIALFAWLLLAFHLSVPAHAGPFENLCGQTLTKNTTIRKVVETLPKLILNDETCEIRLASGVKLKISSVPMFPAAALPVLIPTRVCKVGSP